MAKSKKKEVPKVVKKREPLVFPKKQLLRSNKYAAHRDALSGLLKDGESYTHDQVEKALDTFYKGGGK